MDFNSAGEQRSGELIPDGTIATVHMTIKPGGAGEGGWLKRNKAGDAQMLELEFTVVDGPHAKRKVWEHWLVEGATEGHAKAAEISASRIRAVLESSNGIRPEDETENAKVRRRISTWGDLDGLRFPVKIGIEKGEGNFKDKNKIVEIVTPDRKAWVKAEQLPRQAAMAVQPAVAAQAAQQNGAGRPAWAR